MSGLLISADLLVELRRELAAYDASERAVQVIEMSLERARRGASEHTEQEIREYYGSLHEDPGEYRLRQAWENLNASLLAHWPEQTDLLPSAITVATLHTSTSVVFCTPTRDGALVVVDDTSLGLINLCIRLAVSTSVLEVGNKAADRETAARVARFSFGYLRWTGSTWVPIDPVLPEMNFQVAVMAMAAATNFILAHEAGHVALGHLKQDHRRLAFGPVVDVVDCGGNAQEHEADLFAAKAVFCPDGPGPISNDMQAELRLFGIRMALQAIAQLDQTYFLQRAETHPSAEVRYAEIIQGLGIEHLFGGDLSILGLAGRFSRDIRTPTSSHLSILKAVEQDPIFDSVSTFSPAERSLINRIDLAETAAIGPSVVLFARIAQAVYPTIFEKELSPALRAYADQLIGSTLSFGGSDESKQIVLATLGLQWVAAAMDHLYGSGWLHQITSTTPGALYHQWCEQIDAKFGKMRWQLVPALAHIRKAGSLQAVLPVYEKSFSDTCAAWLGSMIMALGPLKFL